MMMWREFQTPSIDSESRSTFDTELRRTDVAAAKHGVSRARPWNLIHRLAEPLCGPSYMQPHMHRQTMPVMELAP
jgi:hypothetical protein